MMTGRLIARSAILASAVAFLPLNAFALEPPGAILGNSDLRIPGATACLPGAPSAPERAFVVIYDRAAAQLRVKITVEVPSIALVQYGFEEKGMRCRTEALPDGMGFALECASEDPVVLVSLNYTQHGNAAHIHRAYVALLGEKNVEYYVADQTLVNFVNETALSSEE